MNNKHFITENGSCTFLLAYGRWEPFNHPQKWEQTVEECGFRDRGWRRWGSSKKEPSSNNSIIYVEHLLNTVFIIKHQFNLHLCVKITSSSCRFPSLHLSSLLFPSVLPQVPDYHNGSLWWWCTKQQYGNATYHSPHYEGWMHYVPFIRERSVHYELNSSVETERKRDVNFMSCTLLWRYSVASHAKSTED